MPSFHDLGSAGRADARRISLELSTIAANDPTPRLNAWRESPETRDVVVGVFKGSTRQVLSYLDSLDGGDSYREDFLDAPPPCKWLHIVRIHRDAVWDSLGGTP